MTLLTKAFEKIYNNGKFALDSFNKELHSVVFSIFTMGYNAGLMDGYNQASDEAQIRIRNLEKELAALQENAKVVTQ